MKKLKTQPQKQKQITLSLGKRDIVLGFAQNELPNSNTWTFYINILGKLISNQKIEQTITHRYLAILIKKEHNHWRIGHMYRTKTLLKVD